MPNTDIPSRWSGVGVFMAAFAAFIYTLGYPYVWDDPFLISRVKEAVSGGDVVSLFTSPFYVKAAGTAGYYRPVMFISLLADVVIAGARPWFSHLVNISLHSVNSVLVLFLLLRILRNASGALAGALLFAVLPVHAGAVAAIYNRTELLTLLLLLPLVLYWVRAEGENKKSDTWFWNLALFSFFLACLTKETAFMLPAVLLFFEMPRLRHRHMVRVKDLACVSGAAAAALLVRVVVLSGEGSRAGILSSGAGTFASETSWLKIFKTAVVNMRLAVFPLPGRTHWAAADLSIGWITVVFGVFFVLLLAFGFKKNPGLTARGFIWWLVFTLPVLGFFNLGPVAAAGRYTYIPSVGLCMVFGGIAALLGEQAVDRRRFVGAVLAGLAALGVSALLQAQVWENEVVLFRHITLSNPSYATAHVNLGVALASGGLYDEALRSYSRAEALLPDWADVRFNRGNLYFGMGEYEAALEDFEAVLAINPRDWEASHNRGNVLSSLGRHPEAEMSYLSAMDLNGSSGKPLVGLGVLSARDGNLGRAVKYFGEAARRDPGLAEAYEGLGESYAAMGMPGMAEGAFLKARQISPGKVSVSVKLGRFLLDTARPVQAQSAFEAALSSEPGHPEAWIGLVRSFDAQGRRGGADILIRELELADPPLAGRIKVSRKSAKGFSAGK